MIKNEWCRALNYPGMQHIVENHTLSLSEWRRPAPELNSHLGGLLTQSPWHTLAPEMKMKTINTVIESELCFARNTV